jgi:hypothetical protein
MHGPPDCPKGENFEMTDEKNPKPPKDLSPESSAWWISVAEEYSLQPHHLHLLSEAARCLDRAASAREALRKGGLIYKDGHGVQRARPEAVIEKNSMITFARLLRELRLDNAEDSDADRIPRNSRNWKTRNYGWRKNRDEETTGSQ